MFVVVLLLKPNLHLFYRWYPAGSGDSETPVGSGGTGTLVGSGGSRTSGVSDGTHQTPVCGGGSPGLYKLLHGLMSM